MNHFTQTVAPDVRLDRNAAVKPIDGASFPAIPQGVLAPTRKKLRVKCQLLSIYCRQYVCGLAMMGSLGGDMPPRAAWTVTALHPDKDTEQQSAKLLPIGPLGPGLRKMPIMRKRGGLMSVPDSSRPLGTSALGRHLVPRAYRPRGIRPPSLKVTFGLNSRHSTLRPGEERGSIRGRSRLTAGAIVIDAAAPGGRFSARPSLAHQHAHEIRRVVGLMEPVDTVEGTVGIAGLRAGIPGDDYHLYARPSPPHLGGE